MAEVGGTNAFLTPEICFRLYRLAFKGDEGAFSQTARAIAVLAHEAWHLRGEDDEGVTNCYAFQSGVGLGERLASHGDGGADDAAAAGGEPDPGEVSPGVPCPRRMPERGSARSRSHRQPFSVSAG